MSHNPMDLHGLLQGYICLYYRTVSKNNLTLHKGNFVNTFSNSLELGRAIAQAVPGSGHVGFCDGQKWRWGRFSPRTSVSPANLHSICFFCVCVVLCVGSNLATG
jgi:hypothetical protein